MSDEDIQARVAVTRARLESTLDSIEDRLNVPKRIGELSKWAKSSWEANSIPWIVGSVAAVGAVVGIVAWALSSNDD
jgi:hypothetical protein